MPSKKRMGIKAYTKKFKPLKGETEHEAFKKESANYSLNKILAEELGCDEAQVEFEIAKRVEARMPESCRIHFEDTEGLSSYNSSQLNEYNRRIENGRREHLDPLTDDHGRLLTGRYEELQAIARKGHERVAKERESRAKSQRSEAAQPSTSYLASNLQDSCQVQDDGAEEQERTSEEGIKERSEKGKERVQDYDTVSEGAHYSDSEDVELSTADRC